MKFTPSEYEGIAVLRLPSQTSRRDLMEALQKLIGGLSRAEIGRKLWIVQRGRIREYQQEKDWDSHN